MKLSLDSSILKDNDDVHGVHKNLNWNWKFREKKIHSLIVLQAYCVILRGKKISCNLRAKRANLHKVV